METQCVAIIGIGLNFLVEIIFQYVGDCEMLDIQTTMREDINILC